MGNKQVSPPQNDEYEFELLNFQNQLNEIQLTLRQNKEQVSQINTQSSLIESKIKHCFTRVLKLETSDPISYDPAQIKISAIAAEQLLDLSYSSQEGAQNRPNIFTQRRNERKRQKKLIKNN